VTTGRASTANAVRLRAMHSGPQPLILPNVWDPVSARSFAEAGFAALATSSSAVAATLGYRDGQTPGDEMFAAIARIAASVSVPVTADIETGYGLPPAELVRRLADCGVAGCNLEDSDPVARTLTDPVQQADFLAAVRAEAGLDLVINARVDVFVRPVAGGPADAGGPANPGGPAGAGGLANTGGPAGAGGEDAATDAAVARANAYLAAGADCAYPILAPPTALAALVQRVNGPVNAMYRPGGPSLAELAELGVARITFGGGLHARAAGIVQDMAHDLAAEAAASRSAD
jgi:2-methylisocitrate lyase-like PEP mutase family enzyme